MRRGCKWFGSPGSQRSAPTPGSIPRMIDRACRLSRHASKQHGKDEGAPNMVTNHVNRGGTIMDPKLEGPAELAEKTIEQAEKAFKMFFDAASKSMTSMPGGSSEISKQALTFTEQNMQAAFEHARKLVHATDLQEAMRIQSEFLRSQFTNAGEHMRHITTEVMSTARDATKGKF